MAEVKSCGSECSVYFIACVSCEVVSAEESVIFGVSDDRFDDGTAFEPAFDGFGDAVFLAGNVDGGFGMVFEFVAFVSFVHCGFFRHYADIFLDVFHSGFEGMAVIGFSVESLRVENEVAASGWFYVGSEADLAAELPGFSGFTFADALDFGSVPGIEIILMATLLVGDARSFGEEAVDLYRGE